MATLHEFVRRKLAAYNGQWPEVSRGSGVPYGTIKKIALGTTVSPRVCTLEALAKFFRENRRTVLFRRPEIRA